MAAALPFLSAGGTAFNIFGTLGQGRDAQRIAKQRAEIDRKNAEFARRRADIKAELTREQGTKLLGAQKAAYAAGNVRVDTGAPLVVAAQTERDIAKDIEYIYETGEMEAAGYTAQAGIEEEIGRSQRRKSLWDAFSAGFGGAANFGYLGSRAGWW
jgi:hypothetical protein